MNYEERVIAFIDILGFSDKILNTIDKNTGEEINIETDKINTFFEKAQKLKENHTGNILSCKKFSHFSDSIVISYPLEEKAGIFHILTDIFFFCVSILQDGYLIRGAITSGKLHHSDNKLYGPAMVSAYDMERKIAFYPRIVFEEKIINIAMGNSSKSHNKTTNTMAFMNMIQKDFDGFYYLDYFRSTYFVGENEGLLMILKAFKDRIIELKEKQEKDNSIKSKYLWLKEKYNTALKNGKRIEEKIKIECPALYDFLINEGELSE